MSVGEGRRDSSGKAIASEVSDEPSSSEVGETGEGRRNRPLKDFEAGLRGLSDTDENIAELLANNWQKVVGALVLILVGVWLMNEYRSASASRRYAASEAFVATQTAYEQLQTTREQLDTLELETAEAAEGAAAGTEVAVKNLQLFEENAQLIKSSHPDSILANFAELYRAQNLVIEGRHDEAAKVLAVYAAAGRTAEKTSGEAIAADLAALISARSLLLQEKTGDAQQLLLKTFQRGGVASIQSLVILASIASTPEHREQIVTAAKNVSASHPALAEDITNELSRLGISLN